MTVTWQVLEGDARARLAELEPGSAQTCVTSPPYFGLRDYAAPGQLGLEATPDEYVAALVNVFREVRRVLRDDGTVWLNLGDSYNAYNGNRGPAAGINAVADVQRNAPDRGLTFDGCKPKDLLGIPWMVAFALRADGWYLRADIIWNKPNPMPESVTDRPTKAHEYVFLLSKGPRYFYDADAIREDSIGQTAHDLTGQGYSAPGQSRQNGNRKSDALGVNGRNVQATGAEAERRDIAGGSFNNNPRLRPDTGRNKRSVWTVATQPYPGAHFATFSPKLIEPCILAGSSPKACGECGAPWERVVENHGPDKPNDHDRHLPGGQRLQQGLAAVQGDARWERETLGWAPICAHEDGTGSSVVLDPFAGAGTTGLVALRHNRSFTGIELNPQYADLARWRIRDDAPLLNTTSEAPA